MCHALNTLQQKSPADKFCHKKHAYTNDKEIGDRAAPVGEVTTPPPPEVYSSPSASLFFFLGFFFFSVFISPSVYSLASLPSFTIILPFFSSFLYFVISFIFSRS